MRSQGSPAELERRRVRAIELLARDVPVHAVAERLGVDRRSVRRWKRTFRRHGRAGLQAQPAPGRPSPPGGEEWRTTEKGLYVSYDLRSYDLEVHADDGHAGTGQGKRCRLAKARGGAEDQRPAG